ncbi:MAG: CotH kinase family protein, partial [Planctomycetota bacterium]
ADQFEKIDLRTSQNYSWSYAQAEVNGQKMCTMNRDVFSRDLQREMEQPYTRSRYYHLYLNGHYWGLFQTQERSEARYGGTYLGGDSANYDVIKINGGEGNLYDIEATDGDLTAFNELYNISLEGFGNNEVYYRVQVLNPDRTRNPSYKKYVEIDNLIDYIIVNLYTGNRDSTGNNWYTLRDRLGDEGFRFFAHDSEWTLLDVNEDQTWETCSSSFEYFHIRCLHLRLMDNDEYRLRFADRVHKYFANGGLLTPANASDLFMDRANEIDMAIIAESARWGDSKISTPRTKDDDWLPAINNIVNNYFPYRTDNVLAQLKNRGWFPNTAPPDLEINASQQHGGYVSDGDILTMTNPNASGTIYYTLDGSDPRLPGGGINPAAIAYGGSTPQSTVVTSGSTWHFLDDGSDQGTAWKEYAFDHETLWTKSGPARLGYGAPSPITAIDYGPDSNNKYITTYFRHKFNIPDASIITDLTLDVIRDDGVVVYLNGNEYGRSNMPAGPVDYLTVSGPYVDGVDETTFFDVTKDPAAVSWLVDGDNVLAVELHQSSGTSSDTGFDLQLTATGQSQPGGDIVLNQATRIKARVLDGSEWSALTEAVYAIGPVAESLRITEIMYHPAADPNSEFIELANIGGTPVNLKLASFSQGIDFTFGNQLLAAGDHVVVVRDQASFNTAYPGFAGTIGGVYSGSLDNSGEQVVLEDAVGTA